MAINEPPPPPRRKWWRQGARFLAANALVAAIATVVGIGIGAGFRELEDAEPLTDQLDAEIQEAAKRGLAVSINRAVDLHGTGRETRLLIFRPQGEQAYQQSDELRIYERHGDELTRVYELRPLPPVTTYQRPPLPTKRSLAMRIDVMGIGPYAGTDRQVAVLRLDPAYADGRIPQPVALVWEAGDETYAVRPLLRFAPDLPAAVPGTFAAGVRDRYRPATVPLADGTVLRRVGGASLAVLRGGKLITAFTVRQRCNACPGTWIFRTSVIRLDDPQRPLQECPFKLTQKGYKPLRVAISDPSAVERGTDRAARVPCPRDA